MCSSLFQTLETDALIDKRGENLALCFMLTNNLQLESNRSLLTNLRGNTFFSGLVIKGALTIREKSMCLL